MVFLQCEHVKGQVRLKMDSNVSLEEDPQIDSGMLLMYMYMYKRTVIQGNLIVH